MNLAAEIVIPSMSRLCVRLPYVKPIVEQREPTIPNHIVVAPEFGEIVAALFRANNEELTMHLMYVEAIEIDCQPIINVIGIGAATATIEYQMVGGMLGEAPVADEICQQPIVARVRADGQDGKGRRGQ
jgi:hypothetical protein